MATANPPISAAPGLPRLGVRGLLRGLDYQWQVLICAIVGTFMVGLKSFDDRQRVRRDACGLQPERLVVPGLKNRPLEPCAGDVAGGVDGPLDEQGPAGEEDREDPARQPVEAGDMQM